MRRAHPDRLTWVTSHSRATCAICCCIWVADNPLISNVTAMEDLTSGAATFNLTHSQNFALTTDSDYRNSLPAPSLARAMVAQLLLLGRQNLVTCQNTFIIRLAPIVLVARTGVRDNELNCLLLRDMVSQGGALVISAENGCIALEQLQSGVGVRNSCNSHPEAGIWISMKRRGDSAKSSRHNFGVQITTYILAEERQPRLNVGMLTHIDYPVEIGSVVAVAPRYG